jgi:hypothetical protein
MRRSINGYPVRPRKANRPEHVQLGIQQLASNGVSFLSIKDIKVKDRVYTELMVNDAGESKTIRIDH